MYTRYKQNDEKRKLSGDITRVFRIYHNDNNANASIINYFS